jgi:hypothetical protein
MIYHVLPGDSLVEEFRKIEIPGEVIVCREALIAGPVDAETPDEFWERRARFILAAYGEDEIDYHEKVADELERLGDISSTDDVNLWFEYELFCSVNMWFCLSRLDGSGAEIYRVKPAVLDEGDRWMGFGRLSADDLSRCYADRVKFTPDDIRLGTDLWTAYRENDQAGMMRLSAFESECFPYLNEVCQAAAERETRPAEILAEIHFEGKTEFDEMFSEFSRRAGVYGFGDLQVKRLLARIG